MDSSHLTPFLLKKGFSGFHQGLALNPDGFSLDKGYGKDVFKSRK
jgi:hypothetical protein